MLTSLLLAAALQALPPCELPDLDRPYNNVPREYVASTLDNGVISVSMADPMADAGQRLPGIPGEAPPSRAHSAASAWLWSEASDWLLVPKAFVVSRAAVGVDGSWVIELHHPSTVQQRLRFSSTGQCVGCAYSQGAAYFESYARYARDNEFEFCRGLEWPIVRGAASDTQVRFHYRNAGDRRHDAVARIGLDDIHYSQLVVSGLRPVLRDEMLDAFSP